MSFMGVPILPCIFCHLEVCYFSVGSVTMANHPDPIIIEIVDTEVGNRNHECKEHQVCGVVMDEDVVVRLQKVQVLAEGKEETTIAAYWVTGGIDCCCVGFL